MRTAASAGGARLATAVSRLLGTSSWRLRLWDGSTVEPRGPALFTVTIARRSALNTLLGALPERAFGRAYVSGDFDVQPLDPFLEAFARVPPARLIAAWPGLMAAALALGARPSRIHAAGVEAQLRGRRHSKQRDAVAVRHHYDLPPEFYALWLDRTMTYSCAYFDRPDSDLDTAQQAKLDLVCRKLRLQPGERLLDIGCGWGSLAVHAAQHYGVHALGITLSPRQVEIARRRAAGAKVASRVEFRLADYRELHDHAFDAVASVGMVEHVGRRMLDTYARAIHSSLRPGGRALVHGITCRPSDRINRASFINAFVFPDGELEDVSRVVRALESAGLEARDAENLREHYALTLGHWVRRLDERWDDAVRIVGVDRARVWRLYMSGSIVAFRIGAISVHQTLAVRPDAEGRSGLPLTRADWYPAARLSAGARRTSRAQKSDEVLATPLG